MANNQESIETFTMDKSQEETIVYHYEMNAAGVCTVTIYRGGKVARMAMSYQDSESACASCVRFQDAITP